MDCMEDYRSRNIIFTWTSLQTVFVYSVVKQEMEDQTLYGLYCGYVPVVDSCDKMRQYTQEVRNIYFVQQ